MGLFYSHQSFAELWLLLSIKINRSESLIMYMVCPLICNNYLSITGKSVMQSHNILLYSCMTLCDINMWELIAQSPISFVSTSAFQRVQGLLDQITFQSKPIQNNNSANSGMLRKPICLDYKCQKSYNMPTQKNGSKGRG